MGVPKFFRWISERYPCLSEVVREYQIPTFDNLYLDMNGIIHTCSHPNDFDPHFRISEEKMFKDIFHYIEVLFRMIRPQKLFFMAVDGVAPRAKMNQQRGRRFRSAKEADSLEKKAQERGETLPEEVRFDSNCITPGTVFMARLQEQLKYFVTYKVSTDPLWQKCKVILSGHETPGEGEHKIMDYIRYLKSKPDYDSNTRHCLYGLDADLIMLGLCSHEPHFSLLREEVKFVRSKQKRTVTPEEQKFFLLHLSLLREYLELEFQALKSTISFPFDIEKIIDDWVLMGFLVGNDFIPPLPDMHIANGALPILYEAYIQVLPTVGGYINEGGKLNLERFQKYMEKLAAFDINQFREAYADLKYFEGKTGRRMGAKERQSYKNKELEEENNTSEVAKLSDIIALLKSTEQSKPSDNSEAAPDTADNGSINLNENSYNSCEKDDSVPESQDLIDHPKLESDTKRPMNPDLEALIKETEDLLLGESPCDDLDDDEYEDEEEEDEDEEDEDDENFFLEFHQHKRDYYMNKLEYSIVNDDVLRSQSEGYVRAVQWNLNYYYNGVCSWSWFYPHHYAPYVSDIRNFSDLKLDFSMGKPFLPFQQLLAVLPAASKKLLPEPYQALMVNSESPIINYYPSQFKTDLNGKRQEWEAVVLIPFIDESILLQAMEPINEQLTVEEKKRNSHGPALVYECTDDDLGSYASPEYFPDLSNHHAKMTELWREDISVESSKLVKGLCQGAKLDTFFPGFPTLKHIKYTASLEKRKVKVFEMPSRGDNMILKIVNESKPDVKEVAEELLGRSIFVDWPHLLEANVIAVTSRQKRYFHSQEIQPDSSMKTGLIQEEEVKGNLASVWTSQKNAIQEKYMNRLGVNIGGTEILVQCQPIVGRQFMFGKKGRITLEKYWSKNPVTYALQATVKDISVHDPGYVEFLNLDEVFPPGIKIFLLGLPHYGYMGEVRDYEEGTLRAGRVKITLTVTTEPIFISAREKHMNFRVNYMPGGVAAQRLGISAHLLSRITGTIYIVHGEWSEGAESKTNIGLNLKFNKKNEEVPGYTKKDNGMWLYSYKAVELVENYTQTFPKLFDYLALNTGNDVFNDSDIFSDPKKSISDISKWLKEQPFYKIDRQACGAAVVDPEIVQEIEQTVDNFYQKKHPVKTVSMQVKPHLLFKPSMQTGSLPPDPDASYLLFDRIVNIRESYTVPLGWKGTIIGIHKGEKEADTMYDVVFDKPFAGGMSINCSDNRGYRVPCYSLVNLSHGERLALEKSDQKIGLPSSGKISSSYNGAYMFSPAWNNSQQSIQQPVIHQKNIIPQQHQKQDQNPQLIKQSILPLPCVPPVGHPGQQNIVSSHPHSAFASWRSQGSGPANNQPPFRTPPHSPQGPPQVVGKVNQSWRQRPQQPPPTQLLQRQQPLIKQQPLMQQPLQQLGVSQPGPFQLLMNSAPRPFAQGGSPQKQLQPAKQLNNNASPNEFQLMWSELQGLSKPANVDPGKNNPSQNAVTPQLEVNDSGTEILKKMLRIPEAPTDKTLPLSTPPQTMKQVSVQEMFELARASESKSSAPEENSSTIQLMKMFQMQGFPLPRYTYSENKDDKLVTAQVFLPNMRSFTGASADNKEQAGENAAKVALSQLRMEKNSFPGNKSSSVNMSGTGPLTNNLPSPPQQWYWPQNQQQQQQPQQPQRQNRYQDFPQNKPDWRSRSDHVGPLGNNPPNNMWTRQQQPQMPNSHYSYMMSQPQIRTPPRTNWRDESARQGSQFVPLQAVKQQRSKSGGQQQSPLQQRQQQKQPQSSQVQQMQQQLHNQQLQPLQLQPQWQTKSKSVFVQQQSPQKSTQQIDTSNNSQGITSNPSSKPSESNFKECKPLDSSKNSITSESSKAKASWTPKPRQKKSRIAANFGGTKVNDQS